MLENFIRAYADSMAFPSELIKEAAASDDKQFVLTLAGKFCVLNEIALEDRVYAQAIMAFDKSSDDTLSLIKNTRNKLRNRGGEYGFIIIDDKTGAIGFYAAICLNDCDVGSFFNFMQALLRVGAAVSGIEDSQAYLDKVEAYREFDFEKWLKNAGISREVLASLGFCITFNDVSVLIHLIESNKSVHLVSLIASDVKGTGFVQSIANNAAFNALKGFVVRGNALYFESIICAPDFAPEDFSSFLANHASDAKNAVSVYKQSIKSEEISTDSAVDESMQDSVLSVLRQNFLEV